MKKLTFLLICLLTFLTVFAGEVTEAEALQKAQKFMQVKHFRQQNLRRAQQLETSNAYYIFNVENNGGFVIVAGDDRMTDILGYSNFGSLNPQNVPMNVKWLLRYYQKVASNLSDQPYKTPTSMRSMMPAISPLITTTWDQGAPYNDLCPVYNGHRCITGCVATAMAQVINYNRWPQGPTNIVEAYTSQPSGIEMPQLEPTEFTWDNMTNADISRLMLYCGQAVRMEYGVDASGATPVMIAPALINVFGYSQTTHQVLHSSYDDGWELLMYNELAEGRPIIYDGQGSGGGHEFVCDGYDGNGLFHINWGWSGNEDGFFALTNLNTGSGDYNSDQSATISIQPPTGNVVNRPKAVCLAFDENRLICPQSGLYPMADNVFYEKDSRLYYGIIKKLHEMYLKEIQEMNLLQGIHHSKQKALIGMISVISPFFKHNSFSDEAEYRVAYYKVSDNAPNVYTRLTSRLNTINYVKVKIPLDALQYIIIGPCVNYRRVRKLLVEYMKSCNIRRDYAKQFIRKSKVPFRLY